jgi:hypothetical protein
MLRFFIHHIYHLGDAPGLGAQPWRYGGDVRNAGNDMTGAPPSSRAQRKSK